MPLKWIANGQIVNEKSQLLFNCCVYMDTDSDEPWTCYIQFIDGQCDEQ